MTAATDEHDVLDFRAIFEAAPSPNLIVRAAAPFVIVAANDAYLAATLTTREGIVGRPIFDAFPDNPDDPEATGVRQVRESIESVIAHRRPHTMAVQRYDVPRPDGSGFEERYWSPIHTPVFGPDGEVAYVIQRPENVTEFVRLTRRVGEQDRREAELRGFAELMEDGRKVAEASADRLRESEERFRLMADAVPQIVWIADAAGRQLFLNQQWTKYTGLTHMPATADDVAAAVIHPDDRAATKSAFETTLRTGGTFAAEHRIRAATGEYRWFLVRGEPYRDPQTGEITRCFGASVDIHDRIRAEDAARESGELVRTIAENSTQGMAMMDARGYCTYANNAWLAMTGYSAEEIGSRPLHDLVHHHYPDGRPYPMQECPIDRALPENFDVRAHEDVFFRKDGSAFPVLVAASPIFRDGRPVSTVIEIRNVTETRRAEAALRESERRFRDMADTAPATIWVTEPDGYCSFLSRGWYELTGQTEATGLGFGWVHAVHPEDSPAAREAFVTANAARRPCVLDFRLRRADGEYIWVIDAGRPRFGPSGEYLGMIGSVIDITDRKRAEREREALLASERAARSEAERAGRMKDEFLATLSHELRTPLNAILGWSQIIKGPSASSEDVAQGLEVIERNARAQAQIVEDLLDMSRIISGRVRLDMRRVMIEPILRTAIESTTPAADAKGIRIQTDLDASAGPINGDAARLQQVFWNLLTNAVKFTPGGGRVRVVLERVGTQLEASIIDTGEGIRPDFLPHVFDRFRQADASITRRHGGLGLGLSIVKQLVELHGGTIHAKSAGEGQGSTFTLSLPLALSHPESQPQGQRPHATANSETQTMSPDRCAELAGVKVLVVDDEPDARAMVKRLLEACQAVVVTAASAEEAMEKLQSERPDVLISDIGMPTTDGYAFIRQVRALGPSHGGNVPALALTAYAHAEDRIRAVRAGFQMHVPKPLEPAELIAMVAGLAGQRR